MKTPDHLKGMIGALIAVEKACEGTDFKWLVCQDFNSGKGYLAQITDQNMTNYNVQQHASSPGAALAHALAEFNVRIRKKP